MELIKTSKDIWDEIDRCDLHQKRLGGVDEGAWVYLWVGTDVDRTQDVT